MFTPSSLVSLHSKLHPAPLLTPCLHILLWSHFILNFTLRHCSHHVYTFFTGLTSFSTSPCAIAHTMFTPSSLVSLHSKLHPAPLLTPCLHLLHWSHFILNFTLRHCSHHVYTFFTGLTSFSTSPCAIAHTMFTHSSLVSLHSQLHPAPMLTPCLHILHWSHFILNFISELYLNVILVRFWLA